MRKEHERLIEDKNRSDYWKRWGPYLSERAWGTVREDYSANGDAWNYFTHDQARARVYRWSEDGIAGICDRHQLICFSVSMWNGQDPYLKERLFGLTGPQGNHGEDVKECYFYLDNTPTHSYMKALYKYPQREFPYQQLIDENRRRTRLDPEFELTDTGIFDENRYFDVFVEYAKASSEEILIRITAWNRGPEAARLHLLPTIWFRNTWCWENCGDDFIKPKMERIADMHGVPTMRVYHPQYGERWLFAGGAPQLAFTENESDLRQLFGVANPGFYQKNCINDFVVKGQRYRLNPEQTGTKGAVYYDLDIPPGESAVVRLKFSPRINSTVDHFGTAFEEVFRERIYDADEFYRDLIPGGMSEDSRSVMRQAFAGMLWSKQYYNYDVSTWLKGDAAQPAPPPERLKGRNHEWQHFFAEEIISMPDTWEYPWFAAWDLAFHCVPLSLLDWDFAKNQLTLLCREWYMHPNGQLPAYEWNFSDVNPPVHAWAAHRVYQIERRMTGKGDFAFLERIFHKLLINFTWWVNRKDTEGNNIFEGGFLGLDNIGAFDRSEKLPGGAFMEQSDGTSWMASYCLSLLMMALDLAIQDPVYEDTAIKFWEHFLYIVRAMNNMSGEGIWDEEDGFYYDVLHISDGEHMPLKTRSMVGLIPLIAVQTLEPGLLERVPNFARRIEWYLKNRPELTSQIACMESEGKKGRQLLAIVDENRLRRILKIMLDENEFLSPHGIRSLSRVHKDHPFRIDIAGREHVVDYAPGESTSDLFGGNSNWRGPIWFPMNFLIIEALQRYYHYYGDQVKVECPTGSGKMMNLGQVATELSYRLTRLFTRDADGRRPVHGRDQRYQNDPHWKDLVLFYEYFHGDNGTGLGASHQTGWTGLIAKLMQQNGEPRDARGGAQATGKKQAKSAK